MNAIVRKWGNSLALRIPSSFAKDVHLSQGSMVDVAVVEGRLVVKPTGRRKVSLSGLLKGITKDNRHSERDWGGLSGREAW